MSDFLVFLIGVAVFVTIIGAVGIYIERKNNKPQHHLDSA